ncbi:MAG: OmpA family protein, partial [Bacteroidetes bacterium]|nr:OmpA family protein [Bacteroidota bacterium]
MRSSREKPDRIDVWPAFSDTMLAFLLVVVIMLVFQVARNITIVSDASLVIQRQVQEDQDKVRALVEDLGNQFGTIEIANTDGNAQEITLGSEALFAPASATLSPRGEVLLSRLVRRIVREDVSTLKEIIVKGHTDERPISTSTFPSNWELSTARASRVVRSLIEGTGGKARIDPNKV